MWASGANVCSKTGELILAEPDHVFVQADLKGIDNRSVAGLSGDTEYAKLLARGVEINAELCRLFYGDGADFKQLKPKVKAIGHGINFGRGPRAIARDNDLDLDEVKRVWSSYFEAFPDLAAWQLRIRAEAEAGWSLPNGHGRRVRCEPGREYTEAPARQTAACTRDLAMTGLLRLRDDRLLPYLRMFIHDEVVLSVPGSRGRHSPESVGRGNVLRLVEPVRSGDPDHRRAVNHQRSSLDRRLPRGLTEPRPRANPACWVRPVSAARRGWTPAKWKPAQPTPRPLRHDRAIRRRSPCRPRPRRPCNRTTARWGIRNAR